MVGKQSIEEALGRRLLLGEMIARNASKFPHKEALVFGETRLTYKQFNARINQLAHALLELGVTKGAKVAILAFNCNQFMEAYFALAKIAAVAVPRELTHNYCYRIWYCCLRNNVTQGRGA